MMHSPINGQQLVVLMRDRGHCYATLARKISEVSDLHVGDRELRMYLTRWTNRDSGAPRGKTYAVLAIASQVVGKSLAPGISLN